MQHDPGLPRLDIRLPVIAGLGALGAFSILTFGIASLATVERGLELRGATLAAVQTSPVVHARGGVVADVHVADGQHVAMGDVLMTFDTQAVQEQIGALKAQSDAAVRQLGYTRTEALTVATLIEKKLAQKSRLADVEKQILDAKKEAESLKQRIEAAQLELDASAIKAPVAGRIAKVNFPGRGQTVAAGDEIVEIVPDNEQVIVEGRLAPDQVEGAKLGSAARVLLISDSWRSKQPLGAKLSWVASQAETDQATGQSYVRARVELSEPRGELSKSIPLASGLGADVLIVTGERTLLSDLIEPVRRRLSRILG